MNIAEKPTIDLTTDVKKRLRYYAEIAPGEISMHGKSHRDPNTGHIVVTDLAVLPQVCTAAHTIIDDEDTKKWTDERRAAGDNMKDWNVWIHTHGDMAVHWSKTDTDTMEDQAQTGAEMLVSIVTNKAHDYKGRVDFYFKDPLKLGKVYQHSIDDVPVCEGFTEEQMNELAEEIKDINIKLELIKTKRTRAIEIIKELTDTETELKEQEKAKDEERFVDEPLKAEIKAEVFEKVTTEIYNSKKDFVRNLNSRSQGSESWRSIFANKDDVVEDNVERTYVCPHCLESMTEAYLIGTCFYNIKDIANFDAPCPHCSKDLFEEDECGVGMCNRAIASSDYPLVIGKKKRKKLASMTKKRQVRMIARMKNGVRN